MSGLRWVRFESAALGGEAFEVTGLDGEEELNRLFRCTARLTMPGLAGAEGLARELLESPAALVFEDSGAEVTRIHGMAAEVLASMDATRDAAMITVTLVPRIWLLSQTRRSEIFLDRSVPEILAERLAGAGLREDDDFVLALRGAYPAREHIGQYAESDLDFFCRLCEDLGIVFFFRHERGRDVLVLTDTPDAFEPIACPGPDLRLCARRDERGAFEITEALRRVPERALVHDNNHRAPQLELLAASRTGKDVAAGSWIEYGVHAKTPEEAAHVARVRAEELGASHEVITGKSTEMALRAGTTCRLVDGAGRGRELVIVKVTHRAHLGGEAGGGGERSWHNELTAIPKGTSVRPPRRTAKPRVPGLIHAVVDGALKGPYAELDEAGRYKVRFGYDLSGRTDLLASRPVRMLQPHAGARYGLHLPLRPGTEVLIAFVEGDPDRPVIVGAIPNAEAPSPVEQSNQTQNVLRTASENEIVLEDLAGHERIRLHTPHATTTLQLGAQEEPEEGALIATDASITSAAARSINDVTDRSVLLCATSSALVGDTAVLLAGVDGLLQAAEAGVQRIGSVTQRAGAIIASLDAMAAPDGDASEGGEVDAAGLGGRFSDLAAGLDAHARRAAIQAVSVMASAADVHTARSLGRLEGELLGEVRSPSVLVGSPEAAVLFGRDKALVHGGRAAVLASDDTATVIAAEAAQLKSVGRVEVTGLHEAKVTSLHGVDIDGGVVRIAAGYFSEPDAEPLDARTSVGVLARKELRLKSGEECILICAHKNVLATAHTGSMTLKAGQAATISAGSVVVSGGAVSVRAQGDIAIEAKGDIRVKAAGTITIDGGTVEISGGTIVLKGSVEVAGDLTVSGTVNGKRL